MTSSLDTTRIRVSIFLKVDRNGRSETGSKSIALVAPGSNMSWNSGNIQVWNTVALGYVVPTLKYGDDFSAIWTAQVSESNHLFIRVIIRVEDLCLCKVAEENVISTSKAYVL